MTSSIDRLLTLESAAQVLELSPSTLRRWLRQGRIHGHTLNTAPWSDLLDFTTARPATYFRVREVLAEASR
jgi:Helix-turn-helix domain